MASAYDVLGVAPGCDASEIRRAYRSLALVHHPDRRGGSAAAFARIRQAMEQLSTQEGRDAHDARLRQAAGEGLHTSGTLQLHADFRFVGEENLYVARCRCGDTVEVAEEEVRDGINVLECGGCSLLYDLDVCKA